MKIFSILEFALVLASGLITLSKLHASGHVDFNSYDNGSLRYLSNDNAPYGIVSCVLGSPAPNCHCTIMSLSTNREFFGTIVVTDDNNFYQTIGNTSMSIIGNSIDTTSDLEVIA